jgi:acyl-coenzyme A thioesterase PaaI-like protein
MVPYTGSIRPRVLELAPGHARVAMRDRRALRNHLDSLHAVAILNLAEVTSGLAMLAALPPGLRAIVTELSIEYPKKGRGTLIAATDMTLPSDLAQPVEIRIEALVRDAAEDLVARATASWRVAPRASSAPHPEPATT